MKPKIYISMYNRPKNRKVKNHNLPHILVIIRKINEKISQVVPFLIAGHILLLLKKWRNHPPPLPPRLHPSLCIQRWLYVRIPLTRINKPLVLLILMVLDTHFEKCMCLHPYNIILHRKDNESLISVSNLYEIPAESDRISVKMHEISKLLAKFACQQA